MVPTPQEPSVALSELTKDAIVISGMSGTFPKSLHVKDLSDMLYNKVDPLVNTKPRWDYNHPELPPHFGKIPELDRFDSQFFKVNSQLSAFMDPMARKLMDHVYRAIYDAGLSADHLNGKNIGVYMGASASENEKYFYYDMAKINPSSMVGNSKAMFSNRISYWLNVCGPSVTIDGACSSSFVALEKAVQAIKRGDCEAAIVGGASVNLHPHPAIHFARLMHTCTDGKTKSYDQCADGCVKSEAVSVLFLQKAEDALRFHAEVVHVKNIFSSFGLKPKEGDKRANQFCNSKHLAEFMQDFYKEANVWPGEVEYVEGLGVGDLKKDKAELEAIEEVFCRDRSNPLLVGSVTSNIGYTEAASGLSAIIKVLLGYHKGVLAANLHCSNPRQDLPALQDGRMSIVTEHTPFNRTYAAVNNYSATGINGHVLLRGCYKTKKISHKLNIPYLIPISGRQESSVQVVIEDLSSRPIDAEEIALLHNIHESKNISHLGRGFVILDSNEEHDTVCLSKGVVDFDDMKRPLWFVYSGMGSQWSGMGAQLMRIPVFAAAIQRCHNALEPKGLNIVEIITSDDKTIFDDILHSFVGIAAVQIGLTDVLKEIGVVPDKIIGHSVGELGCAYGDGCLSAEEMILSAYSRGLVSKQTKFIRGSMAAVGIGYREVVKMCPPEIEVACHNGPESSTISGPEDAMREFVEKLTAQGIFAKEVPCSNIAYHSRYIAEAGPNLFKYLSEVIKDPKPRTERWLSTSVPQEKWSDENAQYCSAWYHTNNLLSPVLFEETSRLIPAGAVLIEIAPHGLLQAILKRSLHPDCRHIPLTKRGHPDNTLHLLEAIGKLYMQGFNPKIKNLYPAIDYPVSTETPLLSHLVQYSDGPKWALPLYKPVKREQTSICNFYISIHDDDSRYLLGNHMRGKVFYPFSAALVAVWDTFAMTHGVPRNEMSIQFREVHLLAQPVLLDKRYMELNVTIHRGTGEFEVLNSLSKVATGFISQYTEQLPQYENSTEDNKKILQADGIYKLLEERDYSYHGVFCSIHKSNYSFTKAELLWNDNWVTLIDGLLQLNALRRDHDTVSQPSHIHKIVVDLKTHQDYEQIVDAKIVIPAVLSPVYDSTRCGGILLEKIRFFDLPPLQTSKFELQTLVPVNQDLSKYMPWKENVAIIRGVTLQSQNPGDLNSLSWVETSDLTTPSSSDVLVTVRYAGLNLYDLNIATKAISSKRGYLNRNVYGMDYCGTTHKGERVMGLVRGGAASSCVRAIPELMWPVPEHWTPEDAATVPLAYAQAFYCLGIKALLYPGMTILVHGGAGALGQAVISIALANQCKVFTTVGDERKKKFLLKLFPELTEEVIGYSRSDSFGDLVRNATNGQGCDIIITCAKGGLKNTTLNCGSYCGIIFDMVQAHCEDSYAYGMHYMTKQRSYVMIDFFRVFENIEYAKMIQSMMSEGIARGYVRPLSRVTYAAQEAKRAFRLLAASRHRGRVLLRMRDAIIPARPSFTCTPNLYQVVVCKEDDIGLQFVDRLVKCGARRLILQFNNPSPLLSYKKELWKNLGVEVMTTNLKNADEMKKICADSSIKIEGVFMICHGEEQDFEMISNLKIVFQKLSSPLKYFAMLTTKTTPDDNVRLTRTQLAKLPTTLLFLRHVLNLTNASQSVSRCSIMDIIQRSICSNQRVLKVDIKDNLRKSVLGDIVEKAGLILPERIREDMTLQELGLKNCDLNIIQVILQYTYHTSVPVEQIPALTVSSLKNIERQIAEPDFKQTEDLSAFFAYDDEDEHLGSADMVVLPTLVRSMTVRDEEVDLSKQYLWIIPGLEGHYERFRTFCQRLKLSALVLQPGVDHIQETIQETAQRYVKVLEKRTNLKDNNDFYLLGYEAGVLIALEVAAILEEKGMTGTVYCVGGGPEEIVQEIKSILKHQDGEKLQNNIITHLVSLMSSEVVESTDAVFEEGASWQDKLDKNLRSLMKNVKHTTPYVQATITAAYARLQQALGYTAKSYNLKSRVVVLRSSTSKDVCSSNKKILSRKPISMYDLQAPLMYTMKHPRCVSIVNAHLSNEILEKYKSQNHCEAYLSDLGLFMLAYDEE